MKLSSVTTSQLEYLVAALDHPTWRDAAAAVGVTPSALSQGIGELERRLGLPLFDRQGRRRTPNPEAERVRFHAERMLAELRELGRWADEVRDGAVGQLSVGMIDTAAIHHFGDTLVAFRERQPELAVRLVVQSSNHLLDRLRAGELDAVVAVDPDDEAEFDTTSLLDEALHVYAPPGAQVGAPSDWGPWVGFPASSRTRSRAAAALRRQGAGYEVVAESSQPAVLREMVRLGMGWCVLPASDAEVEPHALVRAIEQPLSHRTLTLVTRMGRPETPALSRLVGDLTETAARSAARR